MGFATSSSEVDETEFDPLFAWLGDDLVELIPMAMLAQITGELASAARWHRQLAAFGGRSAK
jgi:hypothetical protein